MELLKKIVPAAAVLLIALAGLGNKGCEEGPSWEHPKTERTGDCSECHDDGMTIKTIPKSHDLAFELKHGEIVLRYGFDTRTTCMLCHSENTCTSCHQQEKPRDHNQFFRLRGHGLKAGLDRSSCITCHKVDSCQRCHANTEPRDHNASFGASQNRHCLSCHFPLSSIGAQRCAACHRNTPSHDGAPRQPANSLHRGSINCRSAGCHTPLRHADNGMACEVCHPR